MAATTAVAGNRERKKKVRVELSLEKISGRERRSVLKLGGQVGKRRKEK